MTTRAPREKKGSAHARAGEVFGGPLRAAIYARVSTADQHTLPEQVRLLEELARRRGWEVVRIECEVASGASTRAKRNELLEDARRRALDAILVWKLDRWGRSVADLVATLHEMTALGVVFVSLTEALDMSPPSGRALAGMLAVFAEFERDMIRERVRGGLDRARREGKRLGRPRSASSEALQAQARALRAKGHAVTAIARRLGIGETSVRRIMKRAS
jgi:putative DNA-invertase from lambdoid prophage Rac